jgi:hypothetical protein
MTEHLTNEQIEGAFAVPTEILKRLPDSIESREAGRLVRIAEELAHEARDRAPRPNGD